MDSHGGAAAGSASAASSSSRASALAIFWSFWLGLIIVLIGLLAFGGFVRGKWY